MAAEVTLLDLKTRARELSGTVGDPNVTETQLVSLANRHASDLWDKLVDAGPPDYAASTTQVTTTIGVIPYALPATFRNLTEVYLRESTPGQVRRLLPMPEGTRANYAAPSQVYTVDLEYVETCPVLTDDADTIDGVSGWDEMIACLMARDVLIKRNGDTSDVLNNIARLESRILRHSRKRDRSPKRIVDLDDVNAWRANYPTNWVSTFRLACYRLRAGNIELYEFISGLP